MGSSTADLNRACTSSIYSTTYDQLLNEFHCSQEVATLGLSLFIWGMGKSSGMVSILVLVESPLINLLECRYRSISLQPVIRGKR